MSFAGAAALSGIAQIGNTMLSQYYNKKNMRDQAKLEYQYAQRYAQNSPTWNVEGLRTAGLNPILAVSNGVNLGANIPNISNSSPQSKIDIPFVEALKASKETDIGQQNADSNAETAEAQATSAEADMLRAQSDANLKQAQTANALLQGEKIKNELKGKGYKNPLVNDVIRGMNDTAEALNNTPSNSPTTKDSASEYINTAPTSSDYSKNSLFGSVQARIDADNEVKRITGKSYSEIHHMSDAEKTKILKNHKKSMHKSKGYHIFTR